MSQIKAGRIIDENYQLLFQNYRRESKYQGGKKYCRRCEVYFLHDGLFCPCCGMRLRLSPVNKRDRNRLREIHALEKL